MNKNPSYMKNNSKKKKNIIEQIKTVTISNKPKKKKKNNKNRNIKNSVPNTFNKLQRMSPSALVKRYQNYQTSYARAILVPECVYQAKIPSIFPQPTISIHKHMTIPFTTSTNGLAAFIINPYIYLDTTTNASYTGVAINNSALLSLNTAETVTGYSGLKQNFGLLASVLQEYRLVSASVTIVPQSSVTNSQGTIASGVLNVNGQTPFTVGVGGNFPLGGALTIAANVDNSLYYQKANVSAMESLRMIYFPLDPSYENYLNINNTHGVGQPSQPASGNNTVVPGSDFWWVGYITGTAASAPFVFELDFNFEALPTIVTESTFRGSSYCGNESSSDIIKRVCAEPEVVSHSGTGIDNFIDEIEVMEESFFDKSLGFINNTFDFVSDHAPMLAKGLSNVVNLTSMF
jgi:hypothetical protein